MACLRGLVGYNIIAGLIMFGFKFLLTDCSVWGGRREEGGGEGGGEGDLKEGEGRGWGVGI